MPDIQTGKDDMHSSKRWQEKLPDLSAVITRFPLAALSMAIFTILVIIFKDNFNKDFENIGRLCVGLIIGSYASVSMTLAAEGQSKAVTFIKQSVVIAIICALAWFSKSLKINLLMAVGASVLVLGNMVRWRRSRDDLHVWDFTHKLWTGAVFAVVGSIIFTLGLIFISEAVKSLFGMRLDSLVEDLILPIGLGLLAPLYWLSTLPPANETYLELYESPGFVSKAISFLGTWLLAPLTLIFSLILVAYGIKIIIAGTLPKGEIAQMTLPFLIVGTLTWLVLEPPFIQEKFLAKLFRRAWWFVSIPASLLLMVAVFVRIHEYGYTPERCALVGAVLWTLGLGLWFGLAPQDKRDIRIIPGLAAGLLIIGTFGAGWFSQINQAIRFETNLIASGLIENDVEPSNQEAARKARGAFDYLLKNQGEKKLTTVLKKFDIDMVVSDDTAQDILKRLGLDKIFIPNRWEQGNSLNYDRPQGPIFVAGYDALYGPYDIYNSYNQRLVVQIQDYKLIQEGERVIIKRRGEILTRFDPSQWFNENREELESDQFIAEPVVIYKGEVIEFTMVITNANEWKPNGDNDDKVDLSMGFYILSRNVVSP